ncbi:hypothetical protein EZV62_000440 [Acer yangbiense]|uniref:Uncharacterized protein n=1 Tax=Acer yangbiense TaxID=1000413 RepID=A0A5C7IRD0_9ROSI|nr:hypothetical protein EZV62_000440 [Acer yangbiense]
MQVDIQIEDQLNEEFSNREPSGRRLDLSLQIPPKPLGFGSSRNGKVLQSQGSYKGSSPSPGGFFWGLSFKKKSAVSTSERSSLSTDSQPAPESPNIANVSSAFSWQRCVSLPVTLASARMSSEQDKLNCFKIIIIDFVQIAATRAAVSRSLSVPGINVVIVRSISLPTHKEDVPTDTSDVCGVRNDLTLDLKLHQIVPAPMEANDEEIDEEEAVRLDLYMKNVQSSGLAQKETEIVRAWRDFMVHVLISTMCYFLILEQLLIPDMNAQAIIIAVLFAFTFGLLSSTFAVILAIREYIWIYAALEFFLVAIIVQLFYIMLHVEAIFAILISAVLGFGTAMSLNSLYIHYFAWRVTVAQNPSSPV